MHEECEEDEKFSCEFEDGSTFVMPHDSWQKAWEMFPCDAVRSEEVGNVSVIPLEDTVAWAQKYEINFQPALEMLDEMYKLGIDVKYSERQRLCFNEE